MVSPMEDKELYSSLMHETSEKVSRRLFDLLEQLKQGPSGLHELCSELVMRRNDRFMVRAYLARMAYEVSGGTNWASILDFCAAVELKLVSMYHSNRLFDEKGEKKVLNDYSNQVITAFLTDSLANKTFEQFLSQKEWPNKEQLSKLFSQISHHFYVGQYEDINLNTYPSETEIGSSSWERYTRRCYGINAAFTEIIAQMSSLLADATPEKTEALATFGREYGIALQIVNDIADFVPPGEHAGTSEKLSTDSYSDVLHGKLTAPILFTLAEGTETERQQALEIFHQKADIEQLKAFTALLARNGSFDKARRLARHHAKLARKTLEIFSEDVRRPLSLMLVLVDSNRYYKALEQYKN